MTRAQGLSRIALLLLATASLSACISTDMSGQANGLGPRYPTHRSGQAQTPQTRRPDAAQGQAQGAYKVGRPYEVGGTWYTPKEDPDYDEVGIASWYGDAFQLKATASGEHFDMYMPSAAHKTLPLQSLVEVTNLENGRRIQVRINDRGPFVDGRIIDLSRAAAEALGMLRSGVARVRVRYVGVSPTAPQPPIIVASNGRNASPARTASPAPTTTMAPIPNPPDFVQVAKVTHVPSFEVQAAAFADPGAAERVRRQLAGSGDVVIRPLQRDGGTLYRVMISSLQTENAALMVREQLAALGFVDARVIRPF